MNWIVSGVFTQLWSGAGSASQFWAAAQIGVVRAARFRLNRLRKNLSNQMHIHLRERNADSGCVECLLGGRSQFFAYWPVFLRSTPNSDLPIYRRRAQFIQVNLRSRIRNCAGYLSIAFERATRVASRSAAYSAPTLTSTRRN